MVDVKFDPREDGVSHINVYSRGRTALGQEASNFSFRPFRHPKFGNFSSVEAFWYWLGSGQSHNEIRHLFGASAKMVGARLPVVPMPQEEFQEYVREAIRCKYEQHEDLRQALIDSVLPFVHYYVRGRDAIVQKKKHDWQMVFLEELRREFQASVDAPDPEPSTESSESEVKPYWNQYAAESVDDLFNGMV